LAVHPRLTLYSHTWNGCSTSSRKTIYLNISSTYGEDERTVPYSYTKVVCNQFAQLGARGVTFLCASGDNGVGPSGTCITNDGKNTPTFLPSFHNTCPKSPTLNPNTVYLCESSGRAYPDIAAQVQQVATICNGRENSIDGTSASTPIVAGVLTLVNDALIAAGKSPLGFPIPWLYSKGYKTFTHTTNGGAAGCNTTGFPA
jgi:tripeptidyl-peptidase-1